MIARQAVTSLVVLVCSAVLAAGCSALYSGEPPDGSDFIPQDLSDMMSLPSVSPEKKAAALEAHLVSVGMSGAAIAEVYVVQGHACAHPRIGTLPQGTLMTDLSPSGPTLEAYVAQATGYGPEASRTAADAAVWAAMQAWCPSQAAHAFGSPVRQSLRLTQTAVDAVLSPDVDWSDRHGMLSPQRDGLAYLYQRLGLDEGHRALAAAVADGVCSTLPPEDPEDEPMLAAAALETAVRSAGVLEMESFSAALAEGPARLTSPADHTVVLLLPGLLHCPENEMMVWLYESSRGPVDEST